MHSEELAIEHAQGRTSLEVKHQLFNMSLNASVINK